MDFSEALIRLKEGKKMTRQVWYRSFVVLQPGYPNGIPCNEQTAKVWGLTEGDTFKVSPYFQVEDEKKMHTMWTPSNQDIMAEDWMEV